VAVTVLKKFKIKMKIKNDIKDAKDSEEEDKNLEIMINPKTNIIITNLKIFTKYVLRNRRIRNFWKIWKKQANVKTDCFLAQNMILK
jgi:hypothetical protein